MSYRMSAAALIGVLALAASVAASAQNLSLRAPAWAQPLLATDVIPTTGGRAVLAADGVEIAARVTVAPGRGGVARVIRYDQRGGGAQVFLRRFTGHGSTGWWLWGSDAPLVSTPTNAQRAEIASLVRTVMGAAGSLGGSDQACPAGEQAYVEVAIEGRSTSLARACVADTDAAGRLVLRLSELAGSRTEEELAAAAVAELMQADRDFAALARAEGVPAAFNRYAGDAALMVTTRDIASGRAGVAARFQNWPQGARLEWAPETARVSARGDMGWTWGNSVYTAPDGVRTPGRYVTVWTRDYEGNWRFSFDAPLQ